MKNRTVTCICVSLIIIAVAVCIIVVIGNNKKADEKYDGEYTLTEEQTDNVLIKMRDGGEILIELYPDIAPITVANFKSLVAQKFYDGITFHRVVDNFVIQAGDPTATGTGGSGKTIKGEFLMNGVENSLLHKRGVLSMARKNNDYNSATSQFFIVLSEKYESSLDGQYASFGKVISGMDIVDRIASVDKDPVNGKPYVDQTIEFARFVKIDK